MCAFIFDESLVFSPFIPSPRLVSHLRCHYKYNTYVTARIRVCPKFSVETNTRKHVPTISLDAQHPIYWEFTYTPAPVCRTENSYVIKSWYIILNVFGPFPLRANARCMYISNENPKSNSTRFAVVCLPIYIWQGNNRLLYGQTSELRTLTLIGMSFTWLREKQINIIELERMEQ